VVKLRAHQGPCPATYTVTANGRDGAGRTWGRWFPVVLRTNPTVRVDWSDGPDVEWVLPRGAMFEPGPLFHRWSRSAAGAPQELAARSNVLEILPANLRLRHPMRLEWGRRNAPARNVGLYQDDGDGWSWVASPPDSARGYRVGETRHLGRFALFADTVAPRVTLRPAPRGTLAGPYSRWALEARVAEEGSGVDRRGSWFEVDGQRRPAEWDDEAGVLRWRPLRPPRRGTHRVIAVVRDRAGNERKVGGRFDRK